MESNGQCDILIVNRAANGFQGAISSQNMETRLHYADKLAENIKQNKMGYLAVKLLTGILKSKEKFDHPEIQTVEDFINYLEKKTRSSKSSFRQFQILHEQSQRGGRKT